MTLGYGTADSALTLILILDALGAGIVGAIILGAGTLVGVTAGTIGDGVTILGPGTAAGVMAGTIGITGTMATATIIDMHTLMDAEVLRFTIII